LLLTDYNFNINLYNFTFETILHLFYKFETFAIYRENHFWLLICQLELTSHLECLADISSFRFMLHLSQ